MSYGTFLMGELARAKNLIDKELEYDLMFETIEAMYKDFNNTTFALADKSEYDCIVDYLDYIDIRPKGETIPRPTDSVINCILLDIATYTSNFDGYGVPIHEPHTSKIKRMIKSRLGM